MGSPTLMEVGAVIVGVTGDLDGEAAHVARIVRGAALGGDVEDIQPGAVGRGHHSLVAPAESHTEEVIEHAAALPFPGGSLAGYRCSGQGEGTRLLGDEDAAEGDGGVLPTVEGSAALLREDLLALNAQTRVALVRVGLPGRVHDMEVRAPEHGGGELDVANVLSQVPDHREDHGFSNVDLRLG